MMDALKVLAPGPYTTVQDPGRFGYQQVGIPVSGSLDPFSSQIANLLVGNPPESAVLEITILGPRLCALIDFDMALCGAEMDLSVNDAPANRWETVRVKAGETIAVGQAKTGCRGYLAVGGGIDVPLVMGSRSTYVGASLGGYQGRCLQTGDILKIHAKPPLPRTRRLPEAWIPGSPSEITLRVVPGPQDDFFDAALDILFQSPYMVTPKADRMGYRLQGPALEIKEGMLRSIISEPTMPGGIQIPADRQPIILLVEQTVGGYAKIGTVITPDLPRVAQATPGDTLRFQRVTLEDAHRIYKDHRNRFQEITEYLSAR
ncbi:MAG: biotin-dependent carboxyltransferase [Deltaproteobacteria bacterium]|nr:biotin-dependent carboxyltransferase [Deltaproteobacteria bacterium]